MMSSVKFLVLRKPKTLSKTPCVYLILIKNNFFISLIGGLITLLSLLKDAFLNILKLLRTYLMAIIIISITIYEIIRTNGKIKHCAMEILSFSGIFDKIHHMYKRQYLSPSIRYHGSCFI